MGRGHRGRKKPTEVRELGVGGRANAPPREKTHGQSEVGRPGTFYSRCSGKAKNDVTRARCEQAGGAGGVLGEMTVAWPWLVTGEVEGWTGDGAWWQEEEAWGTEGM